MKRTQKWPLLSSALLVVFTVLSFSACQDWGQMDPPAGNQVFPKLELKGDYKFDEELSPEEVTLSAYDGGEVPQIKNDDFKGKVLNLNGGYARLNNPLYKVKVQTGVSVTFWVKSSADDLKGAIFSFANEDNSERIFFTPNAWLHRDSLGVSSEVNNPVQHPLTPYTPNEWHFLALSITNEGYTLYIDGEKNCEELTENGTASFDYAALVQAFSQLPYLYFGYGSGIQPKEFSVDDVKVYRNVITEKEIAVPTVSGGKENINWIMVGLEDNSTPWWTYFSKLIKIPADQTLHYGFRNYNSEAENWKNWLLVVSNGKDREEAGYAEHFVLRSDNYAWGDDNFKESNLASDFNFDTFAADMNGAWVDMTIQRNGAHIDVKVLVTPESGEKTYTYTFSYDGATEDTIGAFLLCEGSHLMINPSEVYLGNGYASGTKLVGPEDCSAGWWSVFSDFYKLSGNTEYPFVFNFVNNNTGTDGNWNNWLIVATNGIDRGGAGYAEYFVLRADAYGWGDGNYSEANLSNGFDFNGTTFVEQMHGAYCSLALTRTGARIDMKAKIKTTAGEYLPDYTFHYDAVTTSDIGFFLTVEKASLDIRSIGFFPYYEEIYAK